MNKEILFKTADMVRKQYVGDSVHLRALIEISNICKNNCHYCGIRCANKLVKRYKLSVEEILLTAKKAKTLGFKTVVLQSGESPVYSLKEMEEIIKGIKKLGLIITLSLGEKTEAEYKKYKAWGADRYLLRIETTDEKIYKKLHPGQSLTNRKQCLFTLKKLGFETGTGILTGLPGQTAESIAKDILFIKKLGADMVGLGPFIPAPNTPLAKAKGGSLEKALEAVAIIRLLLPKANIPATTAMETLASGARKRALRSGANVLMPNLTPERAKKAYSLYQNKSSADLQKAKAEIKSLGRKPL